jgi:hypothetical protein
MISSLMEAAGRQLRPQVAKVVGCNNEVLVIFRAEIRLPEFRRRPWTAS